ncbi:MAG: hypothetical protein LCH26_05400 [Proteobacteria bacterium]|nr:hypothetical protein [Pseudomonadota bacterium]
MKHRTLFLPFLTSMALSTSAAASAPSSLLDELETFLAAPRHKRPPSFSKEDAHDCVTFRHGHLSITSANPNTYLRALEKAPFDHSPSKLSLQNPESLDTTLLPKTVRVLFIQNCTFPANGSLIEDISKLPALSSLIIMGHKKTAPFILSVTQPPQKKRDSFLSKIIHHA